AMARGDNADRRADHAEEEHAVAPQFGRGVDLRDAYEKEQRNPWVVPARMRRTRPGRGGANFDRSCRIRTACEVEPVAEDGCVVRKPNQWGRDHKNAGEPECWRPQVAVTQKRDANERPSQEGENPSVVACVDSGNEDEGNEPEKPAAALRISVEGTPPLDEPS